MFCPCISVQAACTGARAVTGEGSQGQPHGTVPAFRAFLCPDRNAEPDIGRIGCGSSNSSCLQVKSVTIHFYLLSRTRFFDLVISTGSPPHDPVRRPDETRSNRLRSRPQFESPKTRNMTAAGDRFPTAAAARAAVPRVTRTHTSSEARRTASGSIWRNRTWN